MITLTSQSTCFSAKAINPTLNFGTLGVASCLLNSGTSVAELNIWVKRRTDAFNMGAGSFF
jgi:hypothetical protein